MRRLFTTEEALARGLTVASLRWSEQKGRWRRIAHGVYGEGSDAPSRLDRATALAISTGGVASGHFAGVLHGLDSVGLRGPVVTVPLLKSASRAGVRRGSLSPDRIMRINGLRCTDGLQTLIDLAVSLDDARWEQALESGLRMSLTSIAELERELPVLSRSRTPGTKRIARVLTMRPPGAPPTESLLETLMVQLARTVPGLPIPTRQLRVENAEGLFVARVDLAWPELGLFIELDGEHHKGQPVYDASRETAIVAATGWLCGRFTWTEVVHYPKSTAKRLAAIAAQSRRRPMPAS